MTISRKNEQTERRAHRKIKRNLCKGLQRKQTDSQKRVTPRQYYTFHIHVRTGVTNYLHLAGRLFQEWLCMAWFLIENQRLEFQRKNQKALRADTYRSIQQMAQERHREIDWADTRRYQYRRLGNVHVRIFRLSQGHTEASIVGWLRPCLYIRNWTLGQFKLQ